VSRTAPARHGGGSCLSAVLQRLERMRAPRQAVSQSSSADERARIRRRSSLRGALPSSPLTATSPLAHAMYL